MYKTTGEEEILKMFERKHVKFPNEDGIYIVRIQHFKSNSLSICVRSIEEKKQWSGIFNDVKQCSGDAMFLLSLEVLLDNFMQAIAYLDVGPNLTKREELCGKSNNLEVRCKWISVGGRMCLLFSIPFGVSDIKYAFPLEPKEMTENELLSEGLKEVSVALMKENKRLKEEIVSLTTAQKYFFSRNVAQLKKMGYTASYLEKLGFSIKSLLLGWPRSELSSQGLDVTSILNLRLVLDEHLKDCDFKFYDGQKCVRCIDGVGMRYVTSMDPLPSYTSYFKMTIEQLNGAVCVGIIDKSKSQFYSWTRGSNSHRYDNYDRYMELEENDILFFQYNPSGRRLTVKKSKRLPSGFLDIRSFDHRTNCISCAHIIIGLEQPGSQVALQHMTEKEEEYYYGS